MGEGVKNAQAVAFSPPHPLTPSSSIINDAYIPRLPQRIDEKPHLTRPAQLELKPPMHLVLQIIGRHVFHLLHQLEQGRLIVRLFHLLRCHRWHFRVGEDVDAHDVMPVRRQGPIA
jgi:hypothetical protein